ncbi:DUF2530 domain-containing protein [Saccharopolyspora sp. NFXS83]|uniref:DUF2530 domain-containing protein n=1 Tax=Saccharopolyspora sp. NFXS83 TaxID=2993560 RepID=UPI002B055C5B|nr:DUF2530 domain-containing protein [Saccharopolyspora sp. NFXS83]
MAEDSARTPASPATTTAEAPRTVPALPRRLAQPTPVVLAGTGLWLAGLVLFAVTAPGGFEFWTCVAGFVLGLTGYGVFRWQRNASRRGSRGAWKGLSGLDG